MDIKNRTFKEIENEFNEAIASLEVKDNAYPATIKAEIFNFLKKKYPELNLRRVDSNNNRFKMEFDYKNDFKRIENFDKGRVIVEFSIKTKKTDQLEKISATKNKYIHTKHPKPIALAGYETRPSMASFAWLNEEHDDIRLRVGGGYFSDGIYGKNKDMSVSALGKKEMLFILHFLWN